MWSLLLLLLLLSPLLVNARLNDDYCDKGDDEPGTAACAGHASAPRFRCEGDGRAIFSSRVGDGVKDCCDCGDEPGLVGCVDSCVEEGRVEEERREREATRRERGAIIRESVFVAAARGNLSRSEEQQLVDAEEEARLKMELAKVRAEFLEGRRRRTREALGLQSFKAEELREVILDVVLREAGGEKAEEMDEEEARERERAGDPYAEVEADLMRHSGSGEGESIGAIFAAELRKRKARAKNLEENSCQSEAEMDGSCYESSIHFIDPNSEEELNSPERLKLDELELKLGEVQTRIRNGKEFEKFDFGPDQAFWILKGACFKFTDPERSYVYEMCPFGSAKQDAVALGQYTKFENNYTEMLFEGGRDCWKGHSRSLRVILECGTEDSIISVSEPETCTYEMHFQTPASCF